jgi:uncharacterized protein (DUF1778 family)
LGVDERRQIAGAAARLGVTLSAFLREAALEAAARVVQKVSIMHEQPVEASDAPVTFLDESRSHHFVDGICVRCWLELSDGRESPCSIPAGSPR